MDIASNSETKFLGIHISVYMKWDPYVRSLISKLSKFCYMIKSLEDITSLYVKEYLFCIFSSLKCGLIYYGGDKKYKSKK